MKLALTIFLCAMTTLAQHPQLTTETIEAELKGAESHTYEFHLKADEYARVVVVQQGIDVVIRLKLPAQTILEINSYEGTQGEDAAIVAGEGSYLVEISPREKGAPKGRYTLRLSDRRTATDVDMRRIEAQRLFTDALKAGEQPVAKELEKAVTLLERALSVYREINEEVGQGHALINLGVILNRMGKKKQALDILQQALQVWKHLQDRRGEADALLNMGVALSDLGFKRDAIASYEKALAIWQQLGDRLGEAITVNNLGKVYSDIGENRKSKEYLERALEMARALGETYGEAVVLNNLAQLYRELFYYQEAIETQKQVTKIMRELGNKPGEAMSANNLALNYENLGDKEQAMKLLEQALEIAIQTGDKRREGITLSNIGLVYYEAKELEKSKQYYERALQLKQATNDRVGEAITLTLLGHLYAKTGEYEKARDLLERALAIHQSNDNLYWMEVTHNTLAYIAIQTAEYLKAEEHLQKSLKLNDQSLLMSLRPIIYLMRAYLQRARGNLQQALKEIEESLRIVDKYLLNIQDRVTRSSFFSRQMREFYELYIDILMRLHASDPKAGYDMKALLQSEKARAHSLVELLQNRHSLSQADARIKAERQEAVERLRAKTELLARLRPDAQEKAELFQEVQQLISKLREIESEISRQSPKYASLISAHKFTPEQLYGLLDKETVLLEYLLTDERSYLWLVTSNGISSYLLPPRKQIDSLAREVYEQLIKPETSETVLQQLASRLSSLILAPVAGEIRGKRLLIAAQGSLNYIPFGILPSLTTGRPLIDSHEIVSIPSASALLAIRETAAHKKTPSKEIAILADPVFSSKDPRLSGKKAVATEATRNLLKLSAAKAIGEIPRLPGTRREAEAIAQMVTAERQLLSLDFDANLQNATSESLNDYRIIHFATHGYINTSKPELSALIFSLLDRDGREQDGYLLLPDIFDMQLSADMVVLSACETGLGQEMLGEGLIGMTRGFLYAGASRVTVSLWAVNDEATAQLMKSFYKAMLKERMRPAAALSKAIRETRKRWSHPYYWAAFQLQGEWR